MISSASSKTSYGTAFLLDGIHRVGLTSEGNRAFTESLGCYDEVLTYDEVADMPREPSRSTSTSPATPPFAAPGARAPRARALGGRRRRPPRRRARPRRRRRPPRRRPTFFFAPDQMRKRYADWGPDGVEQKHAEAWDRFAPVVADWVDVVVGNGPEALRADWLETLAGSTPPRTGHVIQL